MLHVALGIGMAHLHLSVRLEAASRVLFCGTEMLVCSCPACIGENDAGLGADRHVCLGIGLERSVGLTAVVMVAVLFVPSRSFN